MDKRGEGHAQTAESVGLGERASPSSRGFGKLNGMKQQSGRGGGLRALEPGHTRQPQRGPGERSEVHRLRRRAPHAVQPGGKLETAAEVLGFRPASPPGPPEQFPLIPLSREAAL